MLTCSTAVYSEYNITLYEWRITSDIKASCFSEQLASKSVELMSSTVDIKA